MRIFEEQEDELSDFQELDLTEDLGYSGIEEEKNRIRVSFIVWLFMSTVLALGVLLKIRSLYNMDIPAHICAGIIIASLIFLKVSNAKKAFLIALAPFILWELIEFSLVHFFGPVRLHGLFVETMANRVQDVSMDTMGFIFFLISTKRKF